MTTEPDQRRAQLRTEQCLRQGGKPETGRLRLVQLRLSPEIGRMNIKQGGLSFQKFSLLDRKLLKEGSLVEKIDFLDLWLLESVSRAQKAFSLFF